MTQGTGSDRVDSTGVAGGVRTGQEGPRAEDPEVPYALAPPAAQSEVVHGLGHGLRWSDVLAEMARDQEAREARAGSPARMPIDEAGSHATRTEGRAA
ncbi:hypothetical protein H0B56_07080 [Haloechinothrix sp. YIM 98757]|uniref:Uncharacterized protein n=1 Tax=Haloechinothrix aidingensis TaxID=2752311 RepID=A0A838A9H2_9PSEU|nr:DUF6222 family protein [Haloechinothrix aidingensis]MBA0125302.1 hypothetical protein [Haloechinothrix aidingensis]